jgi:dihydroxyacetone kinase-like predicted kinase
VYICHNGNTLSVNANAVNAHLSNHSDGLGDCNDVCNSAYKNNSNKNIETYIEQAEEVKIYPNPSNGNFVVELPSDIEAAEISMVDITGKLVERKTATGHTIEFNHTSIAQGVYMLHVRYGDETYSCRIVIH